MRTREETKRAVEKEGRRCILISGDVADPDFCKEAVAQTVKELGRLDILVNNAAFQEHVAGFRGPDRRSISTARSRPTSTAISTWRRRRCRT